MIPRLCSIVAAVASACAIAAPASAGVLANGNVLAPRFAPPAHINRRMKRATVTKYFFNGTPNSIAIGADGAAWFAVPPHGSALGFIGRIDPGSQQLKQYPVGTTTAGPQSLIAGPDSDLWFVVGTEMASITTSGTITLYADQQYEVSGSSGLFAGPFNAPKLWTLANDASGKPYGFSALSPSGKYTDYKFPLLPGYQSWSVGGMTSGPKHQWFCQSEYKGSVTYSALSLMENGTIIGSYAGITCSAITYGPVLFLWANYNGLSKISTDGTVTPIDTSALISIMQADTVDGSIWYSNGNAQNYVPSSSINEYVAATKNLTTYVVPASAYGIEAFSVDHNHASVWYSAYHRNGLYQITIP
jgi:hypothetical protein